MTKGNSKTSVNTIYRVMAKQYWRARFTLTDFMDEAYKGKIELELMDTEPKGTEQSGAPCF